MIDRPAYERDPGLATLETDVVATGVEASRPYAVLADTVLYPEGGGQPADRGTLGALSVVDVQKRGDEIRHYLEAPLAVAGRVTVVLDRARRLDHTQQHTAQHLLTAVAADRLGWETTAFHLGPAVADVELAVPSPAAADLERLEDEVAREIRAAHPVRVQHVSPSELRLLPVRSRGLPEGHQGAVRLVEIAGIDLNTCGGTHLSTTAEIEALKLLGTEKLRGGTRLFFVAGGRVRRRLAAHEARAERLRVLLGAPDEGLAAAVEGKLAQLAASERRLRAAEEELAVSLAATLAASPGPVVALDLPGREMPFLQRIAREVTAQPGTHVAFLTAAAGGEALFVLAAASGFSADLGALGKGVAARLGGRGGGSGLIAQGKAPSLATRGEALGFLSAALGR